MHILKWIIIVHVHILFLDWLFNQLLISLLGITEENNHN